MTPVFVAEAVIQRPLAEVWKTLTDWTLAPHWMFGISSATFEPDEVNVGQKITLMANGKPAELEVGECHPPEFVQLVANQSGMTTYWDYELDDVTSSVTHLQLTVWCELEGWRKLTAPAVHLVLRRGGVGQPTSLARYIHSH